MNLYDRQYIGTLIDSGEVSGKDRIFINQRSYIQYWIKSLLLPLEATGYISGYISSIDEDCEISDEESKSDEERMKWFESQVEGKFFIFSYRIREDGFANIIKASLIEPPKSLSRATMFYAIPVFSNAQNEIVREWEEERGWKLFREYKSREEFIQAVKNKKALGRVYGYYAEAFAPSFAIWLEEDGTLTAIGTITKNYYNSLGSLILESESDFLTLVELDQVISNVVYNQSVNPTLLFLPDTAYQQIKSQMQTTLTSLETEKKLEPPKEESVKIDPSVKSEEVLLHAMEYYSQKQGLFYDIKDLINFHTVLKCSSLVILSGLSGTGKSVLPDIYVKSLGIDLEKPSKESQFLFLPVTPSWNDEIDLLGYVDVAHRIYQASRTGFIEFLIRAQQKENQNKLFFVCFDEMNLARIEHYFSPFLSILERPVSQRQLQLYNNQSDVPLYNSKEYPSKVQIGDNVRFLGTISLEESAYHFSDRVLDRVNVISLKLLDYSKRKEKKEYDAFPSVSWTAQEYDRLIMKDSKLELSEVESLLWDIHILLQSVSAKMGIGLRIVNGIKQYLQNIPKSFMKEFTLADGIDYQIAQRVLPKICGSQHQLGKIFSDSSEHSFYDILKNYSKLSDFKRSKDIIKQKQRELEFYGYCS